MRTVVVTASADPRSTGSVPQIGFHVAKGVSDRTSAILIFHATDRSRIEGCFPADRLRFAGSRRLARMLRRISLRLFRDKWNLITVVEFIDYLVFDVHAYLIARRLVDHSHVDYVLRVNPVSLRVPSLLSRLDVPVFTGPHNGGMEWPPGFAFLDAKERTGQRLRPLGDALHRAYGDFSRYARIFVANEMCGDSVPARYRDKLVLLPENGVDRVKPPSVHAGDARRLLFVGRLTPYKGVEFLIRALTQLPDSVSLTIVGDGPQRDELVDLSVTLGIGERCRFWGLRPHAELDSIYQEAGVFVFPSVRETGGAVVLEAMSHALPCVVAGWGGPATYTGSAGLHLSVDSPRALQDDLVRTLEDLLESPESGRALGLRAQARIRHEYVWETKADQLHTMIVGQVSGALLPASEPSVR